VIVNEEPVTAGRPLAVRRSHILPSMMAVVVDLVVMTLVVVLAALGRARLPVFPETGDVDNLVSIVGIPIVVGWIALIAAHGAYAVHVLGAGTLEYKLVVRASLVAAGGIGIVSFLARFQFSRGFFFLLLILSVPLLVLGRFVARRGLHALRRQGHLNQRVLVAGSAPQVDEVSRVLARERWLGYQVVGALLPASGGLGDTPGGVPVLGSTPETAEVVEQTGCDIVLFAGGAVDSARQMRRAAWELGSSGVQIMLVPGVTDVSSDRVRIRPAAGLHLMELEGPRAHRASRISKRLFDVIGASTLLIVFSPVMAATALAIRRHDGGPVLFRQRRVGRDGESFDCLKFRSMVVDAHEMVSDVDNMNGNDHVLFKAAEDPRVTPPGRVIRRYSLDEMPQFINVLRGDMSLVGPRPPLQSEVDRYTPDIRQRLAVRPGMTGLWQVSGRSDLSWEDAVRLDLYYVDNWSLVQDVAILARTMSAVVSGRGAY
jgi:exopolysaccharide biosynthesis polyprenyl glycosylphosphotransferase